MYLLADFIKRGRAILSAEYGATEAAAIISALCRHVLDIQSYTHIINPDFEIPADKEAILENGLERLAKGEPLQYVTGVAEFCGRNFNVSPSVLIPRPETEYLCRLIIEKVGNSSPLSILDICTGSGCIAWTLQFAFPNASVTGVDISEEALEIAQNQSLPVYFDALCQPIECGPAFLQCDVLDPKSMSDFGQFDIIVSNPPYVREGERIHMSKNVLGYEPGVALFVPDDNPLLFYKVIARFAAGHLSPSGLGAVEINEAFGKEGADLFTNAGFSYSDTCRDLAGKDRYVFFGK